MFPQTNYVRAYSMFRSQVVDSKLTDREIILIRSFRKMPDMAQTSLFSVAVSYAEQAAEDEAENEKMMRPKLRLVSGFV